MRKVSVVTAVGLAIAVAAGCAQQQPSATDTTVRSSEPGEGVIARTIEVSAQEGDSGFLRDYTRLEESTDSAGRTTRKWASPKFTADNYNALLIDPVVFYPEPRPTGQVSAETLQQILVYTNDLAKRSLSERFNVVDQAGPGVLRIRAAFTSVGAKGEGLKPYQYIPIAMVATLAKRAAAGGAPQRAAIVIEVEATDSVSGELMAGRVRFSTGERLARIGEKDAVTMETVRPLLDNLAGQVFPELREHVKAR
jgi:hypothetical protein